MPNLKRFRPCVFQFINLFSYLHLNMWYYQEILMVCARVFMKQILDEEITPAMEKLKEVCVN